MIKQKPLNDLKENIDAQVYPIINKWIKRFDVTVKIKKNRVTKLGDYSYPNENHGHVITINEGLNHYSFLVTLVHEFAHLLTWVKHRNKVSPHGTEWKQEFKEMMQPIMELNYFPKSITSALNKYLKNAKASSFSDLKLSKELRKFDLSRGTIVEDIPLNASFKINSGRIFIKGEKVRTRYKCIEASTKKTYLFNPIAEITPIQ